MKSLEDFPTDKSHTDIFELSSTELIAEVDEKNDDGEPTEFNEVVRLFKDDNGKFQPKTCSINILEYKEDIDEEVDIGGGVQLDLRDYIGSKKKPLVFYVKPTKTDNLKLVQIEATISMKVSNA